METHPKDSVPEFTPPNCCTSVYSPIDNCHYECFELWDKEQDRLAMSGGFLTWKSSHPFALKMTKERIQKKLDETTDEDKKKIYNKMLDFLTVDTLASNLLAGMDMRTLLQLLAYGTRTLSSPVSDENGEDESCTTDGEE